ncbi:hypothetical protein SAMN05216464_10463 [Mucilaginibacter pineti]|uniref:Uncharacterized protein n=1 Tax=Mucilaginibacter pineti TaxID=1391627 RepID=A0A1G7AEB1_9SPHI|nr:hypothetical protein [Mucilaginibacter pineti]SDE13139.1 hypothetical protein SAMN05216464_10463 [Mucilaginibacter pineti]
MKRFLGLLLFAGLACNQPVKQAIDTKEKIEQIDWNKAKINGLLPMITHVQQVTNRLCKPDSIVKPDHAINDSFYRNKMTYCYVKGLTYEKYHDTLVFKRMDFRKDTIDNLILNKVKFDYTSSMSYFGRFFPSSYNNELRGTDMDKYLIFGLDDPENGNKSGWMFCFNEDGSKILWIDHYVADRVE